MPITDRLARYDAKGNLSCLVCKTAIAHDALWKAHVLGREHAQAIERLREKKAAASAPASAIAPPAAVVARPAVATVAPASSAAKSSIAALPSDFFDDASSNRPVAGSSKPAAASAPTASSVPRAAATAALPPSSLASAPLVAGKAGADSASAVPAGFFDDPLTEMQVRQIKIEKPDFRNEMRALEREIKQTAADAAKVSEEFQLQLDVLRRREEDSAQSEYIDRVASVREKGADVKRRLEEMREARRAKVAKTAESSFDQEAPTATVASRAPSEWNDMLDWKSKAIAGRAAPTVAASFAAFDAEQQ